MLPEKRRLIIRVILSMLCTGLLFPAAMAVMISPMGFDRPDAKDYTSSWVEFDSILATPVFLIAAIILANIRKRLKYFYLAFVGPIGIGIGLLLEALRM